MGSVAWLIDGNWVARFPFAADARAALEIELALLSLLHDALPVPVPRIEYVVRNPDGQATMSAYRLLDGVPLSLPALGALSDGARARAFDELGDMIDALWCAYETGRDEDTAPDTLVHADLKSAGVQRLLPGPRVRGSSQLPLEQLR
jgi:phosphotransferase family enzyme